MLVLVTDVFKDFATSAARSFPSQFFVLVEATRQEHTDSRLKQKSKSYLSQSQPTLSHIYQFLSSMILIGGNKSKTAIK
jgi:hypothetical protein